MIKRALILLVAFGVVALCPAPIPMKNGPPPSSINSNNALTENSTKYNGVYTPEGGFVPPVSKGPDLPGTAFNPSSKALVNLEASTPQSRSKAVKNLAIATRTVEHHSVGGELSPIWLILAVILILCAGMYAAKTWLEKYGPEPQRYTPKEAALKAENLAKIIDWQIKHN